MVRKLWRLFLERPAVSYTLEDTEWLINQGRWLKARSILRSPSFEQKYGGGASTALERKTSDKLEALWVAYCFQRALVELLTGNNYGIARRYYKYARVSRMCAADTRANFIRDVGLAYLRAGDTTRARACFALITLNHRLTPRRLGLIQSVKARWNVAMGNGAAAERLFNQAHETWAKNGIPDDDQWVMNSRYHWFKLRASRGASDRVMASFILNTDPSLPRKVSVFLVRRLGRVGNRLDDHLQSLAQKAMRLWP